MAWAGGRAACMYFALVPQTCFQRSSTGNGNKYDYYTKRREPHTACTDNKCERPGGLVAAVDANGVIGSSRPERGKHTGTPDACVLGCKPGYTGSATWTCKADNSRVTASYQSTGAKTTWCAAIACTATGYAGTAGSCTCASGYSGTVTYSGGAPTGCTADCAANGGFPATAAGQTTE